MPINILFLRHKVRTLTCVQRHLREVLWMMTIILNSGQRFSMELE